EGLAQHGRIGRLAEGCLRIMAEPHHRLPPRGGIAAIGRNIPPQYVERRLDSSGCYRSFNLDIAVPDEGLDLRSAQQGDLTAPGPAGCPAPARALRASRNGWSWFRDIPRPGRSSPWRRSG